MLARVGNVKVKIVIINKAIMTEAASQAMGADTSSMQRD